MCVVALLVAGFHYGYVASQYDVFRFFLGGHIHHLGSDLPDIDAKRAPISKLFRILVPATVVLVSLGLLSLWPPIRFRARGYSPLVLHDANARHTGSVHTIRAGLSFVPLATAVLYQVLQDLIL